jgi:hypothetical protein
MGIIPHCKRSETRRVGKREINGRDEPHEVQHMYTWKCPDVTPIKTSYANKNI